MLTTKLIFKTLPYKSILEPITVLYPTYPTMVKQLFQDDRFSLNHGGTRNGKLDDGKLLDNLSNYILYYSRL